MRELNKRYLRELKMHWKRYLALMFMIILGMYLVVSIAGMAETTIRGSQKYNEECNLQDGQFTTFIPLTDQQLQKLSDEYGQIEKIYSIDLVEDDTTLRIFRLRDKIDLLRLDEGRRPVGDDQIVIMNLFAERNDIHIADQVHYADRDFTVSGIGCVPDYNLTVKSFSDMTADPRHFGIAFVTDAMYDTLLQSAKASGESYTYAYKLKEGKDAKELKEALKYKEGVNKFDEEVRDFLDDNFKIEISNLESFYENKDNPRIASDAASDVVLKKSMSMVAGAVLIVLFAYVISIFIIHQIQEESSVIGTLYAMGIRRRTLIAHYIMLPTITAFLAGLLGMFAGFSRFGVDFQMQDSYLYYSLPQLEKVYPLYLIVYCLVVPPLLSAFVNYLTIRKKLDKTALSLIKNEQEHLTKTAVSSKKRKSAGNFLRTFAKQQMLREKRSVITIMMGIMLSLIIFMIGLDCYVLCDHVRIDNQKDISYEYMYVLKYPVETLPKDATGCYIKNLSMNYLDYSLDINLIGIEDDNPFYPFRTANNKNELVIASSTAEKYQLDIGDNMILTDMADDRQYVFTVSDIVPYSIGLTAYMDIDEMRELFEVSGDSYNMLLASKKLDVESGKIYSETTRSDIENASGIFVDQMMPLIIILIAVSVLIFVVVLYLMLGVMIDRASFGISLIKIFGYRMREIRKVYLNGTFYAVAIGTAIGIPVAKRISDSIYPYLIANTAMGMNLRFEWYLYIGIFLGVMIIYMFLNMLLTGRIKKIVPAEVLKNRE